MAEEKLNFQGRLFVAVGFARLQTDARVEPGRKCFKHVVCGWSLEIPLRFQVDLSDLKKQIARSLAKKRIAHYFSMKFRARNTEA